MHSKKFSEITKEDATIAGGKGASLGEMTRAGIPVPPGFVILASAFDRFVKETGLQAAINAAMDKVRPDEVHTVEFAAETIQSLITSKSMPEDLKKEIMTSFAALDAPFVAVRSSATAEDSASAAWAGQLDSFLNTTKTTLLENVQKCWSSLFTPRAIAYRFEKGLHKERISVAVVVQKMVQSRVSGIAFSVHPVTEDYDQLIIEAGLGLGEAIVSGQVTPDSYVVDKRDFSFVEKNISLQRKKLVKREERNVWEEISDESQKLSDNKIRSLAKLIVKIEEHYGFPVDIEFAIEKNELFIVQSRPITTLNRKIENKSEEKFEKLWTRDTTTIIQQIGSMGFSQMVSLFSNEKNPFEEPVIHYLTDGVIEIWQNKDAMNWLRERVHKKNKSDPDFGLLLLTDFKNSNKKIKKIGTKTFDSVSRLREYLNQLVTIMNKYHYMYLTAEDNDAPKILRNAALTLRDKDTLWANADQVIRKSLLKIHPQIKGYENALLKEEIDNIPTIATLEERERGFVFIGERYAHIENIDSYAKERHVNLVRNDISQKNNEIKGQIAFRGTAKGIARIVKRKDEIKKVQQGEVLLSPMTTPDFIPAMKKASAIITDEGGITCHAAIIAREICKPCIIGTKVATQVFKDGDTVEVNANEGIVKKISNSIDVFAEVKKVKQWFMAGGIGTPHLLWAAGKAITDGLDQAWEGMGLRIVVVFYEEEGDKGRWCIDKDFVIAKGDELFKHPKKLAKLYDQWLENNKKVDRFFRKLDKNGVAHLREDYEELLALYIEMFAYSTNLDYVIVWADREINLLKEQYHLDKEEMQIVSSPQRKTFTHKESLSCYRLAKTMRKESITSLAQAKSHGVFFKRLQKHQKSFFWVQNNYKVTVPITIEEFFKEALQAARQNNLDEEIQRLINFEDERERSFRAIVRLRGIKRIDERKLRYIAAMASWQDDRKEINLLFDHWLNVILEEASKCTGVPFKELQFYTPGEFRNLLKTKDRTLVNDRLIKTVDVFLLGREKIVLQNDDYDTLDQLIFGERNRKEQTSIKGVTACPGLVRGKAKRIFNPKHTLIKEGEILVTLMTRPEFVPLMKKAGAIVTDEGGITSHAAIVSRELKIPCIIGTGFATSLIRDGDLIEVNANHGYVRIIQRAKKN